MYRIYRPAFGLGQWIAGFVASFCGFVSGLSLIWAAIFYPKVTNGEVNVELTYLEKSIISSFLHWGQMVSTIPSSYMQNKYGRRNVLLMVINFQLLAWIIIYFMHNVWAIVTARFLMGLWIGFEQIICPPYLSENASPRFRGRISVLLAFMSIIGCVYQSAIAEVLSYGGVALASFIITAAQLIALFNVPESIYIQIKSGKHESAVQDLKWLRGNDNVKEEISRIERYIRVQMNRNHSFAEIFRWPPSRKAFLQALSLVVVQKLSGFEALSSYSSIVIPDSWIESKHYPVIWNSINLIFVLASELCVDYVDRKVLLFTSALGSAISFSVVTVWFYLHEKTNFDMTKTLWLPLIAISTHAAFFAFGFLQIPSVFQGEVFPLNIKAKAGSILAFIGFSLSIIVVFSYIPLEKYIGKYSNFLIYSCASMVGCYISTRIIETRNKPLETIQKILEGRENELSIVDL